MKETKLADWLRSNELTFNAEKSSLFFCLKTKKRLDEITIEINKSTLSPVQYVNYLDMLLGKFLSLDAHLSKFHFLLKNKKRTR